MLTMPRNILAKIKPFWIFNGEAEEKRPCPRYTIGCAREIVLKRVFGNYYRRRNLIATATKHAPLVDRQIGNANEAIFISNCSHGRKAIAISSDCEFGGDSSYVLAFLIGGRPLAPRADHSCQKAYNNGSQPEWPKVRYRARIRTGKGLAPSDAGTAQPERQKPSARAPRSESRNVGRNKSKHETAKRHMEEAQPSLCQCPCPTGSHAVQ